MKLKTLFLSIFAFLIAATVFVSCSSDDDKDEEVQPLPPEPKPEPEIKELTFELKVENIKVHGADLTVIPSEKDRKYIADVATVDEFAGKTDAEIINKIIAATDESKLMTGDMMFKGDGMELEEKTEYVLFALGIENGKASGKLARKNFTTAEEVVPLPQLTVEGTVGNIAGENKYSQLTFNVKSDIADSIIYMLADNEKEGQQLEDESYIEKLIYEQGTVGSAEEIAAVNSVEGLSLTFENLLPEHEYTFIARVSNKSGAVTKKATLKTDVKPAPPVDGPKMYISGQTGDQFGKNKDSMILFMVRCESKDAVYAEVLIADKKQIDDILAQGLTLEQLAIANKGMGVVLTEKELKSLNSTIYTIKMDNTDGVQPDTEYTCIAMAENEKGGVTAVREDVKTDAVTEDSTPPSVDVIGMAGDADGNNKSSAVTYIAACTSKDASYAEAFVAETDFVNEILGDMTPEELMEYNAGMGKVLEQSDLDKLNNTSLSLSWNQMNFNTQYTLLLCVKNKGGGMVVKRCEVYTEPEPAGAGHRNYRNVKGMLTAKNVKTNVSGRIIENMKRPVLNNVRIENNKTRTLNYGKLPGMFIKK